MRTCKKCKAKISVWSVENELHYVCGRCGELSRDEVLDIVTLKIKLKRECFDEASAKIIKLISENDWTPVRGLDYFDYD